MSENKEPQLMYTKMTRFGGLSSLVFLMAAIIIIGSELILYIDANIYETKVLIPKVVLDEEVSSFVAKKISVEIELLRYGDKCNQANLKVTLASATYSNVTWTSKLTDSKSCIVYFECHDCLLNVGAGLSLISYEKFCYSSGINVNVTSSSSIPNEISSILLTLSPKTNYVFIGSLPTNFYFNMIPSLFKSDPSRWPSEETGYHVSNQDVTKPGSQYMGIEIVTASLLLVNVNFEINISGLYTRRLFKQTAIFLLSALIGSVFGIMKAVGGAMRMAEKHSQRMIKKLKNISKAKAIAQNRIEFEKFFENSNGNGVNSTVENSD